MWKVTVDKEKCDGCGECIDACPGQVYELLADKAEVVNMDECHGCHTCESVCDKDACLIKDEA
jgi:NAD-dependent dihydropyrimidine dehydrogenase PreA subunit